MKKITVAIALAGTLMLIGTSIWRSVKVQAMTMQINVKDLPEYGIRIIAPSDPSFGQKAQPFLKAQSPTMAGRIKPFSVIIENKGRLAIVGSCVKWEVLKQDGTTSNWPVASVNPRALMDGGKLQATDGAAIPASSIRFVSLFGSAGEGQQLDSNRNWLSFRGSPSESEEFNRALAQGNEEEVFNRSVLGKLSKEAARITVSIDLVFFEDGTFVGDDQSDTFIQLKAEIDSRYDLATEVATARNQSKTPDEIFRHVGDIVAAESRAKIERSQPGRHEGKQIPSSEGVAESAMRKYSAEYNFFKAIYAQELLRMKDALGATEAISYALKLLDKPRKQLRKR